MSTLTRRSSGNRVPDYKDYMSFVSAYRNGKKETDPNDNQNFIISTNNARNMLQDTPTVTVKPCDSYSSFLEKTKGKKFSSVKPPLGSVVSNVPTSKQTVKVKTEIFLEINDDVKDSPNKIEITVKENNTETTEDDTFTNGQVEARKKMFEGRTYQENKLPLTNGQNQKNKILTLKQKLESSNTKTNEENTVSNVPKEMINKINIEKFETFSNHHKTETDTAETKTSVNLLLEKPIELNNSNNHNEFLRPPVTMTDRVQDHINFHIIEKRNNELQSEITTKEKLIGQLNDALKFKTTISLEPKEDKVEEVAENIPVTKIHTENSSIPPPPPPMPNGFRQTPTMNKIVKKTNNDITREKDNVSPPFIQNSSIQEADLENSKRVTSKNQKSSTLERTNPLVRKLAYGAMLDMYGAYHDKANSYVSTLPRQHVKKDNGLQKIIDSIAAQGGLDKLSGRSNPKAENE